MSSSFRRALPARPSLDQQKKLAKELLQAFRAGERDATARIRAELPDKRDISLADAQFVLAREYGFANWSALKEGIETLVAEQLPPVEQFRRAAEARDAKALRRILEQSAKARAAINDPLFGFNSPVLVALADTRDIELIDVLLEFGADPNRRSTWWAGGFHPLYAASGAVADRLLAAGAIPDACAAAQLDRPELLARILEQDPSRVRERGGDGQTPLHFARSRKVVDMLLDAGADINAIDVDHRSTAAEWMLGDASDVTRSRLDVARYLVERGARADIFLAAALGLTDRARVLLEADPKLLSLRTGQGEYGEKKPSSFHIYLWTIGPNVTPLQAAARFQQMETMRVMEGYASPEQRLLLACHRGVREEAQAIVRVYPNIVQRLGPADRRALTDEAWAANPQAVDIMLDLGFDPSVPSISGPTGGNALHCAAWEGSVACVGALLRHPAGRALIDSVEKTYNGTPLSWCSHGSANCHNAHADHASVARLLIAAGAQLKPEMANWEGSDSFMAVIDAALRDA